MKIAKLLLFIFTITFCKEQSTEKFFESKLLGHVILPAQIFANLPEDVEKYFSVSGRFTNRDALRKTKLGSTHPLSFVAKNNRRLSGQSLPVSGQPVQGFSGISHIEGNLYMTTSDNGFGSKANSADALLFFYILEIDFEKNTIVIKEQFILHDPDFKIPFRIVTESTENRYLTGADLDIESIQRIADSYYFGDEFGPYIIKTDLQGKVLSLVQAQVNGRRVSSIDNVLPEDNKVTEAAQLKVQRSRGFEAMAKSLDEKYLYPAFEGPLLTKTGEKEQQDEKAFIRILQFDTEKDEFTKVWYKYRLEDSANSLGDFNMFAKGEAVIIERDWLEGSKEQACTKKRVHPSCFEKPAQFKRVYRVKLPKVSGDYLIKLSYIDLLKIKDLDSISRYSHHKKFSFPFVTIENVDVVAGTKLIIANDNNFGFSSGRNIGQSDDNEFILLDATEFLKSGTAP